MRLAGRAKKRTRKKRTAKEGEDAAKYTALNGLITPDKTSSYLSKISTLYVSDTVHFVLEPVTF